ncbi:MAG: galactokinase [Victivallaceae bacterium]|nr:galactokinase [Victivallaceae bacterium]MDD4318112.1 galactokinase [Victivallaceae bacterium]MDD5663963.1 galactokinase [Victivallaceae bacterium]NLK83669.1 galactokinase [Lentisphaerota bacterium]
MNEIIEKFAAHFGKAPLAVGKAPGRLEILGNHTDYNEGFVLSAAVSQNTEFAILPVEGNRCRLLDLKRDNKVEFSLDDIENPVPGSWANYIKGVISRLAKRGIAVSAFDGAVMSTVPISAGMSSSAALEISFCYALKDAFGIDLPPTEWARVGQEVENEYLGLKSGLLDQFSSIFGREHELILSDFRSNEVMRTVKMPSDYLLIVANSMIKHNLVDSEYNNRRRDCEAAAAKIAASEPSVKTLRDVSTAMLEQYRELMTPREYRRACHVVGENERVFQAVEYLDHGRINEFGQLLFESHRSSIENFENSCPELDYLIELAQSIPGCAGARLSGGGFGGISIHLVEKSNADDYCRRLSTGFKIRTGLEPEIIRCTIGAGATSRKL